MHKLCRQSLRVIHNYTPSSFRLFHNSLHLCLPENPTQSWNQFLNSSPHIKKSTIINTNIDLDQLTQREKQLASAVMTSTTEEQFSQHLKQYLEYMESLYTFDRFAVLQHYKENLLVMNETLALRVVKLLCKAGKIPEIVAFKTMLLEKGVIWPEVFNYLVASFFQFGSVSHAEDLLETLLKNNRISPKNLKQYLDQVRFYKNDSFAKGKAAVAILLQDNCTVPLDASWLTDYPQFFDEQTKEKFEEKLKQTKTETLSTPTLPKEEKDTAEPKKEKISVSSVEEQTKQETAQQKQPQVYETTSQKEESKKKPVVKSKSTEQIIPLKPSVPPAQTTIKKLRKQLSTKSTTTPTTPTTPAPTTAPTTPATTTTTAKQQETKQETQQEDEEDEEKTSKQQKEDMAALSNVNLKDTRDIIQFAVKKCKTALTSYSSLFQILKPKLSAQQYTSLVIQICIYLIGKTTHIVDLLQFMDRNVAPSTVVNDVTLMKLLKEFIQKLPNEDATRQKYLSGWIIDLYDIGDFYELVGLFESVSVGEKVKFSGAVVASYIHSVRCLNMRNKAMKWIEEHAAEVKALENTSIEFCQEVIYLYIEMGHYPTALNWIKDLMQKNNTLKWSQIGEWKDKLANLNRWEEVKKIMLIETSLLNDKIGTPTNVVLAEVNKPKTGKPGPRDTVVSTVKPAMERDQKKQELQKQIVKILKRYSEDDKVGVDAAVEQGEEQKEQFVPPPTPVSSIPDTKQETKKFITQLMKEYNDDEKVDKMEEESKEVDPKSESGDENATPTQVEGGKKHQVLSFVAKYMKRYVEEEEEGGPKEQKEKSESEATEKIIEDAIDTPIVAEETNNSLENKDSTLQAATDSISTSASKNVLSSDQILNIIIGNNHKTGAQ